jgi:hypothetical protein
VAHGQSPTQANKEIEMLRIMTISALLLTFLGGVSTARADDPAAIAARCIAAIELAATTAGDRIQSLTRQTVAQIDRLDKSGATDRVIIATGKRGITELEKSAAIGQRRIATLRADCVQRLRSLNADPALIARVNNQARRSTQSIDDRVDRGTAAVRRAVSEAIR